MPQYTDSQLADACERIAKICAWPKDTGIGSPTADALHAASDRLRGLKDQAAVPREPTQAMEQAGFVEWRKWDSGTSPSEMVVAIWRAMCDAATDQPAVPGGDMLAAHNDGVLRAFDDAVAAKPGPCSRAATDQPAARNDLIHEYDRGYRDGMEAAERLQIQSAATELHETLVKGRSTFHEVPAADPAREFCVHCGAGIGTHRREGEGTCPKCDPQGVADHARAGLVADIGGMIADYCHPDVPIWHQLERAVLMLQRALAQIVADGERIKTMDDAAEMLWVMLANVSGGDWTKQTQEWQDACSRWRDNYFAARKALEGVK